MILRRSTGRSAGWVEKTLWVSALVCSGLCTASLLARESAGRRAEAVANHTVKAPTTSRSGVTGSLRIPSLQIDVPVLTGCSFLNLERGACHLDGSAGFGGFGNAAVAGHRDKDFRQLAKIQKGMGIVATEEGRTSQYIVDSFEIVSPEDVQVLDIHDRPELTLITCYPFHFVGAAPKRFIVHAHLIVATSPSGEGGA